jgi:hypothetical protein
LIKESLAQADEWVGKGLFRKIKRFLKGQGLWPADYEPEVAPPKLRPVPTPAPEKKAAPKAAKKKTTAKKKSTKKVTKTTTAKEKSTKRVTKTTTAKERAKERSAKRTIGAAKKTPSRRPKGGAKS